MTEEKKVKKWVMPEWIEKYRELIRNTGGNSIEELMNDKTTNMQNNYVRCALMIAVESQISLLNLLKEKSFIK
jgi:hypothetical protein